MADQNWFVFVHESGEVIGPFSTNTLTAMLEKNRVQFSQMASTMMACAQGQEIEHAFLRTLEGKMFWTISGNTLTLMDQEKKPVALFGVVYFH
jgi:heat shock protein HslJ